MAEFRYDPFNNNFGVFESSKPTTQLTTDNMPLLREPLDISEWSEGISTSGTPIVKRNLPTSSREDKVYQVPGFEAPREESYQSSGSLSGKKKEAMEFFQSKGLSAMHSAAIVGNLMLESGGLNHKAVNPKSGAYGYAQWLGSRQKKLFAKYGKNPTAQQQLEFIWEELNTDEKSAFNKLLSTTTLKDATDSFMRHFERPSSSEMKQSFNKRFKYAGELVS